MAMDICRVGGVSIQPRSSHRPYDDIEKNKDCYLALGWFHSAPSHKAVDKYLDPASNL